MCATHSWRRVKNVYNRIDRAAISVAGAVPLDGAKRSRGFRHGALQPRASAVRSTGIAVNSVGGLTAASLICHALLHDRCTVSTAQGIAGSAESDRKPTDTVRPRASASWICWGHSLSLKPTCRVSTDLSVSQRPRLLASTKDVRHRSRCPACANSKRKAPDLQRSPELSRSGGRQFTGHWPVVAGFDPDWPVLKITVAGIDFVLISLLPWAWVLAGFHPRWLDLK